MYANKFVDVENLSDDQIDAIFSDRKMNSDKSLLSLYIYFVLEDHSDAYRHLTQQEIIDYLAEPPYSVKVERKAVSRTIAALTQTNRGVYSMKGNGTWMQK